MSYKERIKASAESINCFENFSQGQNLSDYMIEGE